MDLVRSGRYTFALRRRSRPWVPAAFAVVVLFVLSPVVAPGSLNSSSLATMVPFASILAIAAIGQTLVVQQGGLDFSIAGTMTLSAVLVCHFSSQYSVFGASVLILATAVLTGFVSGIAVSVLRITPLIATLGMNAVLLGAVQFVSGGVLVAPAPKVLTQFALGKAFGVFNLLLLTLVLLIVFTLLMKRSVSGRRFEAVGAAQDAAAAMGIRVSRHKIAAYVLASVTSALAGVLLAGFLSTPPLNVGDPYLLSSIAAVVVGGTALGGGPGSAFGSAIAALFLTQLSQLLLATGSQTSVTYLVQGLIIGATVGLKSSVQWVSVHRPSNNSAAIAGDVVEPELPKPLVTGNHSNLEATPLPETQVQR